MPIVSLIVALVIVGVALYLVELLPIEPTIKRIIHVLVMLLVLLWVLQLFGIVSLGGRM